MPRGTAVLSAAFVLLVGARASAAPSGSAPPGCSRIGQGTQAVDLAWGQAVTTPSCFFFSGPGALGRNDSLGTSGVLSWTGEQMTLELGRARFVGSARGNVVRLSRTSSHEYSGRWTVTEVLDGQIESTQNGTCTLVRLTYRYQECEPAGPCPGHCTITAPLTISTHAPSPPPIAPPPRPRPRPRRSTLGCHAAHGGSTCAPILCLAALCTIRRKRARSGAATSPSSQSR